MQFFGRLLRHDLWCGKRCSWKQVYVCRTIWNRKAGGIIRSLVRDRQKIYFVTATEKKVGFDTVQEYGKPIMTKMAVSSGTNMPVQISAGLVVDYDRVITSYDKTLRGVIREGDALYVDIEPQLNDDGTLVMGEDGYTPVTPPDYRISAIFSTQKGAVDVYGIKKVGAVQ